jgi:hypothetical protein
MKVHLTQVYRASANKKGEQYISKKTGKPYERLSIKTQEHGDKWLSGFGSSWNADWQEGDEVDIVIKESGDYLNFERANPVDAFEARIKALEDVVFGSKDNGDYPA